MAIYGYKRCSTDEDKQDVSRQLFNLDDKFDKVFIEYASGKNEQNRPVFQELLSSVEQGDEIWFQELSRAGRNTKQLLATVDVLMDKGVTVKFLSENMTLTNDPSADPMAAAMTKMMLTVMAAMNEMFLTQLSVAVKQGMKRAMVNGVKIGAASEEYKRKPTNPNKVRRKDATERAERLREPLKLLMSTITRPTLKVLAEKLTENGYKLPSGKDGVWSATQVGRVMDKLEMQRV